MCLQTQRCWLTESVGFCRMLTNRRFFTGVLLEDHLVLSRSVVSDSVWSHGYSLPGSSVHGISQAREEDHGTLVFQHLLSKLFQDCSRSGLGMHTLCWSCYKAYVGQCSAGWVLSIGPLAKLFLCYSWALDFTSLLAIKIKLTQNLSWKVLRGREDGLACHFLLLSIVQTFSYMIMYLWNRHGKLRLMQKVS